MFEEEGLIYYLLLLPSTLIVLVTCLIVRWLGLKFFQHNCKHNLFNALKMSISIYLPFYSCSSLASGNGTCQNLYKTLKYVNDIHILYNKGNLKCNIDLFPFFVAYLPSAIYDD